MTLYELFCQGREAVEAAELEDKFAVMKVYGKQLNDSSNDSEKDDDILFEWMVFCLGTRRRILEEIGAI